MQGRKVLTYGLRWTRWLVAPIILLGIIQTLFAPSSYIEVLPVVSICLLLFYGITQLRCLHFDNKNLYVIHGSNERVIPFKSIVSIKRSATKINSERYWILVYKNEMKEQKSIRYFYSTWLDGDSNFNKIVQTQNPDVVIWDHPHFHD